MWTKDSRVWRDENVKGNKYGEANVIAKVLFSVIVLVSHSAVATGFSHSCNFMA